jgi:MFS family permease
MTDAAHPVRNHPLARRMLLVAFLMQSTMVACLYGPFTIMLSAVETRTHATRAITALGITLVSLTSGLLAPLAGYLVERFSLRLLAIIGLSLTAMGYALLAVSPGIHAYLLAYGLLIGPGACLSITVVPTVLITRWFAVHRGRALGMLHMPILSMITPLIVVRLLDQYGLPTDYLFLTALIATVIAAAAFIIDRPPADYDASTASGRGASPPTRKSHGLLLMLRRPVFWALSLSTTCVLASAITLGTHLVPMVTQWGITHMQAATLVSAGSLASIMGALFFGWLADRIGGARTIVLICVSSIAMWGLMLLHPAFPLLIGLVALFGLNMAGVVPAFTLSLSKIFTKEDFGPAYGAGSFVFQGLSPVMAPVAGVIYARTGAYTNTIYLLTVILALGMLLALSAGAARSMQPTAAPNAP